MAPIALPNILKDPEQSPREHTRKRVIPREIQELLEDLTKFFREILMQETMAQSKCVVEFFRSDKDKYCLGFLNSAYGGKLTLKNFALLSVLGRGSIGKVKDA
jgi:hypothetical protein